MLWVGLWVGKAREFCGNPHFHFLEIRSSVGIILRRRFEKPPRLVNAKSPDNLSTNDRASCSNAPALGARNSTPTTPSLSSNY
jgi:hypothetical protein